MAKIPLWNVNDLTNNDIEEMVKHNPQLNKIALNFCRKLDRQILRSIEFLHVSDTVFGRQEAQHSGQFRNMKSLKIHTWDPLINSKYIKLVIQQLTAAKIPLKSLDLNGA